jgi:hypothetical protein
MTMWHSSACNRSFLPVANREEYCIAPRPVVASEQRRLRDNLSIAAVRRHVRQVA